MQLNFLFSFLLQIQMVIQSASEGYLWIKPKGQKNKIDLRRVQNVGYPKMKRVSCYERKIQSNTITIKDGEEDNSRIKIKTPAVEIKID